MTFVGPIEKCDVVTASRAAYERLSPYYRRALYLGGAAIGAFTYMASPPGYEVGSTLYVAAMYTSAHLMLSPSMEIRRVQFLTRGSKELRIAREKMSELRETCGGIDVIEKADDSTLLHWQPLFDKAPDDATIAQQLKSVLTIMKDHNVDRCAVDEKIVQDYLKLTTEAYPHQTLQEVDGLAVNDQDDDETIVLLDQVAIQTCIDSLGATDERSLEEWIQHLSGSAAAIRVSDAYATYRQHASAEALALFRGVVERELVVLLEEIMDSAASSSRHTMGRTYTSDTVQVQGMQYRTFHAITDGDRRTIETNVRSGNLTDLIDMDDEPPEQIVSNSNPDVRQKVALIKILQILSQSDSATGTVEALSQSDHRSTRHDKYLQGLAVEEVDTRKGKLIARLATTALYAAAATVLAGGGMGVLGQIADMNSREAYEMFTHQSPDASDVSYADYLNTHPSIQSAGATVYMGINETARHIFGRANNTNGPTFTEPRISYHVGNIGPNSGDRVNVASIVPYDGAKTDGYWLLKANDTFIFGEEGGLGAYDTVNGLRMEFNARDLTEAEAHGPRLEVTIQLSTTIEGYYPLPVREGMQVSSAAIVHKDADGTTRTVPVATAVRTDGTWLINAHDAPPVSGSAYAIRYWLTPLAAKYPPRADNPMKYMTLEDQRKEMPYRLLPENMPQADHSTAQIFADIRKQKRYSFSPLPKDAQFTDPRSAYTLLSELPEAKCDTANIEGILAKGGSGDEMLNLAVGYHNDSSTHLDTKEVHAWVLDGDGNRYDATPPTELLHDTSSRGTLQQWFGGGVATALGVFAGIGAYRRREAIMAKTAKTRYEAALRFPSGAMQYAARGVYSLYAPEGEATIKGERPTTKDMARRIITTHAPEVDTTYNEIAERLRSTYLQKLKLERGLRQLAAAATYHDTNKRNRAVLDNDVSSTK